MASWLNLTRRVAAGVAVVSALRAEPAFFTARVAPILERHCVGCHGAEKKKAGLRLDSFENVMHGAESGAVIQPGNLQESELFRRITLPPTDEEVMPSDGKPSLSPDEIKVIELWIAAGASASKSVADFPTAPAPRQPPAPVVPLAPDWRPRAGEIARLEKQLGLKLVPRSQVATDGLILRTASAPSRCTDAALAQLAPVAALIVDAELARTKVTDKGLKALAACDNLRSLDLTRTAISAEGIAALLTLKKLESVNLTDTAVDDAAVTRLKTLPALKRLWLFGTRTTPAEATAQVAAH